MHPRRPRPQRTIGAGLVAATALLLGACASYQPHPLRGGSELAPSPGSLQVDATALVAPGLQPHPFDPADGLDMVEVATLAVLNNPALKAERHRRQVARAQLFAAGLLPDPQLSASLDRPTSNMRGLVNAWGLGLGYDLLALITRSARLEVAQAASRQVDLALSWREWQTAQQARSLYVRFLSEQQRLALLEHALDLYRKRYQLSSRALQQGNLTLDVTGTDLTALVDMYTQVNQLKQRHNDTRHELTLLLGLAADIELKLQAGAPPRLLDAGTVRECLLTVARRRPDLLALKAGYQSQEARVR